MTEKELIKTALERHLPDSRGRLSSEIIEAEAKGAQAHIRKRRFAFVGVTVAAVMVVGAAVFGFGRLNSIEIEPPAAESSQADESETEIRDKDAVISLCDFTGKQEASGVSISSRPKNLGGREIKITDRTITVDDREIMGIFHYSAIIKVFTADVTGDGKADVCVESKPAFTADESVVYMFDINNDLMQMYYVPDKLNFTLTEEDDTLKLGMQDAVTRETEYTDADFTVPERYHNAKTEWLKDAAGDTAERSASVNMQYSSKPYGSGKTYIGDDVSCTGSLTMSMIAALNMSMDSNDRRANIIDSIAPEGAELQPDDSPLPISGSTVSYLEGASEELDLYYADKNVQTIFGICIANVTGGERDLLVTVKDRYGCDYVSRFTCQSAGAAPLKSFIRDGAAAYQQTTYYCRDISALGNTSPAPRMLISPSGSFAIAYHIEKDGDKLCFVTDSIQPESMSPEAELTVKPISSDEEQVIKPGRTELSLPEKQLKDGIEVICEIAGESITDTYQFGDSGFNKEFVYLADFTRSSSVTRLNNGEQIRFEKRLGAFPDVSVSMTDSSVTVNVEGVPHLVTKGQPVTRVFASDVNSDGKPEVIAEVYSTDRTKDGDVLVYDILSDKLESVRENFYNRTGIWLDSVRSYLAVLRADPGTAEDFFGMDVPLSKICLALNNESLAHQLQDQLKAFTDAYLADPKQVQYLLQWVDGNNGNLSIIRGELAEINTISQIISDAIANGEAEQIALDETMQRSLIKNGDIALTGFIEDKNISSSQKSFMIWNYEDKVYIKTMAEEYHYDYFTLVMKLSDAVGQKLKDLIFRNGQPVLQNITEDGLVYQYAEIFELDDSGAYSFELNDLQGYVGMKCRAEFDIPENKLTIYTDKSDLAPGVSAEQYDIQMDMWRLNGGYGYTVSYEPVAPMTAGSTTVIDYSEPHSKEDAQIGGGCFSISLTLKLPDGSARIVTRTYSFNFISEGDLE